MHRLIKVSNPGWEKEFETEADARAELLKYICKVCLSGKEYYSGELVQEPAPNQNYIHDLLGTSCGCEFWYEPPQTEALEQGEK